MLSSIDSTTLHSVAEVPGHFSMTSALGITLLLDDDLLPNRNCSGERGERGAGGKWAIFVGESRERVTGDGEGGVFVLRATFPVSVDIISSARSLEKRSDVGITEPRLEVEDMLVNALEGDRTAEVTLQTDDERERFDGALAMSSTARSSARREPLGDKRDKRQVNVILRGLGVTGLSTCSIGECGTRGSCDDERENKRWNVEVFGFSGVEGSGS